MVLTVEQIEVAVIVRRVFSAVTCTTCTFIIFAIIIFRKFRFLSSRLVLWLTVSSALQTIAYFMPSEHSHTLSCNFQAIWISYFDWTIALWICVIAFNLHQTVVQGNKNTPLYEKWYHVFVWSISLLAALIPLVQDNVYGDTGAWCWIVKEEPLWRFSAWYVPLFFFFAYVVTMYAWIMKVLYKQKSSDFQQREAEEGARKRWRASVRLSRYPLIFIIMWIFPLVNRIENLINGDDGIFWLVLMHTICNSIQGTLNSVVYCIDEDILSLCTLNGLKSAFHYFFSKEKRKSHQVKKYAIKHSDTEDPCNVKTPIITSVDPNNTNDYYTNHVGSSLKGAFDDIPLVRS